MMNVGLCSFSKNYDMRVYASYLLNSLSKEIKFNEVNSVFDGVINSDAVFIMSHGLKSFYVAFLCFILNKPLFVQIHDERPHPGVKFPVIALLNWLLVKISTGIIFFSEPELSVCSNHIVLDLPAAITPNCERIKPVELDADWTGYALFGRGESYKYTVDFLDALSFSTENVLFAGRGWRKHINNSNSKVLIIDRHMSNEELAWILVNSKGILLPYKSATQSGLAPILSAFDAKAFVKRDMHRLLSQFDKYGAYYVVDSWKDFLAENRFHFKNVDKSFTWQSDVYRYKVEKYLLSFNKF